MATVIDSLVVTLGLDASQFTKGKTEANKGLEETKEKANNLGGSLKDVAKGAAEFFVALKAGQAIKQFIIDITNSNAQLELMSKNLGINVGELQSWGNIAQQSGGSVAGMQGTMDMLSKSMTEMQLTGETGILPYMRALGVSMYDTSGKARPLNDMLLDLASKFGGMDRTQANNLGRMMGIDQGTMNTLLQGRQAVELMIKRQKEMGLVTKEQGEQSLKLKAAWYQMTQTMTASVRDLVSIVTPALTEVFNAISSAFEWMESHKAFMTGFFSALSLRLTVMLLPALKAVTVAAWDFTAAVLANPLTWAIGAVIAFAAAIGLLYDDYETFKSGGNSLFDWSVWGKGVDLAIEYVGKLADIISNLYDVTVKLFKLKFPNLFSGISKGVEYVKFGTNTILAAAGSKPAQSAVNADLLSNGSPSSRSATQQESMRFFMSKGWTKDQAAGIVGNLIQESNLNTSASGDHGHAYGIGQWQGDRQRNFEKFAGKGINGSSLQDQLAFVNYELTQGSERGAGLRLRGATSASEAGALVSRYYERPSAVQAEQTRRAAIAVQVASGSTANVASNAQRQAAGQSVVETHIGTINVHTQAIDAHGVAKNLDAAIKNQNLVNQADYGAS
jgi:hypothetical protein